MRPSQNEQATSFMEKGGGVHEELYPLREKVMLGEKGNCIRLGKKGGEMHTVLEEM